MNADSSRPHTDRHGWPRTPIPRSIAPTIAAVLVLASGACLPDAGAPDRPQGGGDLEVVAAAGEWVLDPALGDCLVSLTPGRLLRSRAVGSAHGLALIDPDHSRVLWLTSESQCTPRVVGRAGGGPGEFTGIDDLAWVANGLAVLDGGQSRVTVFSPDGHAQRIVPVAVAQGSPGRITGGIDGALALLPTTGDDLLRLDDGSGELGGVGTRPDVECPIQLDNDPFAPIRPRFWRGMDSLAWSADVRRWYLAEGCSGRVLAFDPVDESGLPSEVGRLPSSLNAPWLEWAQGQQVAAMQSGGMVTLGGAIEHITARGSGPTLLLILSHRTGQIAARLESETGVLTTLPPPEWWDPALGGAFVWWNDGLVLVTYEGELWRWRSSG